VKDVLACKADVRIFDSEDSGSWLLQIDRDERWLAHPPPDASADERIAGLNLHKTVPDEDGLSFSRAICFRKPVWMIN